MSNDEKFPKPNGSPPENDGAEALDAARIERLYEDSIGPLLQRYYAELVAQPLPKDIAGLWEKLEQLGEDGEPPAATMNAGAEGEDP